MLAMLMIFPPRRFAIEAAANFESKKQASVGTETARSRNDRCDPLLTAFGRVL
jgi:hypothetical protein